MGYMEIASYLGMVALALNEITADRPDELSANLLQATREAELILFRLAVEELEQKVKGTQE